MKKILPLALALVAAVPVAHAAQAGDWELKLGLHAVDPKSDNGTLAGGALKTKVDSSVRPSVSLEYRITPNLGVEVLGALPFEHEVRLNGGKAASVKHLPPTLSLQWHFLPDGRIDPFVGLGANYTRFFSIDERGPLAGTRLQLEDSWGVAAHAGVAFALQERWSLTLDARWMRIRTDAKVDGAKVGTVTVDPLVYGVAVGYRF